MKRKKRQSGFWEQFYCDPFILAPALMLLAMGLLMVVSSSMVVSENSFHVPFHFVSHQLIYLTFGLMVGLICLRVNIETWHATSAYWLLLSIVLLIVVLIPGVGHHVNGSVRWIGFGPASLQVSEVAKFSVILYLSGYLVRREDEVRSQVTGFLKPMALLGFIAILLLLEPDFGATAVIMCTALGLMFLAGVRFWQFLMLFSAVALALAGLIFAAPYRMARLTTFLHPWANQYDSGYQLTQSLIAFGRGGVFGVGLGNSIQKLFYLPEAHTDFLFAVLAEELGLLGGLAIIALFVILVGRAMQIGYRAYQQEQFVNSYLASGFGLWLGLQAVINIGVNTGILPTKGLTLPLMSYGGSSMVINCVVVAILLRISSETNQDKIIRRVDHKHRARRQFARG